jgi:FtsZ-binding cell division protein ZapB
MLEELVDLGDWSQTAAAISEELLEQRNDLQRQRDDLQRQRDDLERERDALVQQRDDPTGLVQRNVWLARVRVAGNPENADRDSEHSDE